MSTEQQQPAGDPGKSLVREIELLRAQVAQLTQATRALVTLQSVMDKKLDVALKGGAGADFAVI
jgi:hypothetical protein